MLPAADILAAARALASASVGFLPTERCAVRGRVSRALGAATAPDSLSTAVATGGLTPYRSFAACSVSAESQSTTWRALALTGRSVVALGGGANGGGGSRPSSAASTWAATALTTGGQTALPNSLYL